MTVNLSIKTSSADYSYRRFTGEKIKEGKQTTRIIFEGLSGFSATYVACENPNASIFSKACTWIQIKTGFYVSLKTKQGEIAVNCNSLAKRLGLSKQTIKKEAQKGTLETYIKEHVEEIKGLIKGLKDTGRESSFPEKLIDDIARTVIQQTFSPGDYRDENGGHQFIFSKEEGANYPKVTFFGKLLGEGGFGEVYAAADSKVGKAVFKVAKNFSLARDDVENEFTLLRELHDGETLDGVQLAPFKVVYLEGNTVYGYLAHRYSGDLLNAPKAETGEQALDRTRQIISGLCNIHKKETAHRDIKPGNILYDDKRFDISDFGGARKYSNLKKRFDERMSSLNRLNPEMPDFQAFRKHSLNELYNDDMSLSNTPGYTRQVDEKLAREAITLEENFENFISISKKMDTYSTGLSLVEYFFGADAREETFDNRSLPASFTSIEGLSSEQFEIIKRMVSARIDERPTTEEMEKAFANN